MGVGQPWLHSKTLSQKNPTENTNISNGRTNEQRNTFRTELADGQLDEMGNVKIR